MTFCSSLFVTSKLTWTISTLPSSQIVNFKTTYHYTVLSTDAPTFFVYCFICRFFCRNNEFHLKKTFIFKFLKKYNSRTHWLLRVRMAIILLPKKNYDSNDISVLIRIHFIHKTFYTIKKWAAICVHYKTQLVTCHKEKKKVKIRENIKYPNIAATTNKHSVKAFAPQN